MKMQPEHLEYAYADFTIAKMAEKMGEKEIADRYLQAIDELQKCI